MPVPRSNISRISIQNFKFFQQAIPIVLDGDHLLLYGENGSGKSSIYWALYTLLECANKDDIGEIKKYFDPDEDNEEKLTNLFLTPGNPDWVDSEIIIELQDGTVFRVSFGDTAINTMTDASAANYASEFLNYKMIFRLYNFAHCDPINIFNYFIGEVLPYVKFAPVKYWLKKDDGSADIENESENAKEIWDFVFNGPPRTGKTKGKGTPRFPLRSEADFGTYKNIINGFKNELNALITTINTEGNKILQNDFGYNFNFKLELIEEVPLKLSELQFSPPKFAIQLSIPLFQNKPGIYRPHTFLNEARLSALGLSIRFAILQRRLQDSKLKMAILDDFMISLDMKNRDVALDFILDKISKDYQLLILTHDRYLYELIRDKIKRQRLTDWKYYQMFEDYNDPPTMLFPFLIEDKGKINKAKAFYKAKEFSASANATRQAAEKFCNQYLTAHEQLGGDYRPMSLDGKLQRVIIKGTAAGIDPVLFQDLRDYKDRILNPNSHYDIETPLFSNELEKAIQTIERLSIVTGIIL